MASDWYYSAGLRPFEEVEDGHQRPETPPHPGPHAPPSAARLQASRTLGPAPTYHLLNTETKRQAKDKGRDRFFPYPLLTILGVSVSLWFSSFGEKHALHIHKRIKGDLDWARQTRRPVGGVRLLRPPNRRRDESPRCEACRTSSSTWP